MMRQNCQNASCQRISRDRHWMNCVGKRTCILVGAQAGLLYQISTRKDHLNISLLATIVGQLSSARAWEKTSNSNSLQSS